MTNIEKLQEWSIQRIMATPIDFKRYLWPEVNWNDRLIIVAGARGVGKTTLLLQYLKERFPRDGTALFASLDGLFFSSHTLVDLAESFVQQGGKFLALDEVHKYPGWSREVKIIYDQFPGLQLVLSGSSAVELLRGEGDLSRRARIYRMYGMSFREYLHYDHGYFFPPMKLDEMLDHLTEASVQISGQIKPLQYFSDYLRLGYYPFFKEDEPGYHDRLRQIVNVVIESDIPAVFSTDYQATMGIRKLLGLLTEMMPYKPNIQKLSEQVGLSRETLIKYLQYLGKADVLQLLYSEAKGVSLLNKPEKVYLHNPNLIWALSGYGALNKGSLRETFFLNQLSALHEVRYGRQGDFLVDGKFTFEVGGAKKDSSQIRDIPNAWIAADDVEIGVGRRAPLWLFGFLY
jgi:predicted AAA+ superfamily ATPase